MEKVLIYTGRFQPFHSGHIKCIKEAYEKTGLRTVIVITTSTNRNLNSKYPFTKEQTLELILDSIQEHIEYVAHFYIEEQNPNVHNVVKSIRKFGFEPSGWIFGVDRIDIKKQVENTKYHEDLKLKNFKSVEISRSNEEVSASLIRKLIKENSSFEHYLTCSEELCNKVKEWHLMYLYHQVN